MWTDDGPLPETRAETGLVITQILDVAERSPKKALRRWAHYGTRSDPCSAADMAAPALALF